MIELKNVSAGYNEKIILKHLNVSFEQGKITVIIGPNGSGKSTLLKTIVQIIKHTQGDIFIDEIPIEQFTPIQRAQKIAYLAQNKNKVHLSALKMVLHGRFPYLSYPRKYRKEDIEIARKALQWVQLDAYEDVNVSELSGGNQQSVYIAMALAQDTNTILLDEPTTYLDISHQLNFFQMIQKLTSENKSVVMVLHDLIQAFQIADHLILINDGEVIAQGNPEEIFNKNVIQKIFDIQLERIKVNNHWQYYYSMNKGERK